jgi:hypothetical protein
LRRLWGRDECGPGFPGFRLIVHGLAGNGGDANQMIAGGTLDLAARKLRVALKMLVALGTGEFELVHGSFLMVTSEPYEKRVRLATSCVIALFQQ